VVAAVAVTACSSSSTSGSAAPGAAASSASSAGATSSGAAAGGGSIAVLPENATLAAKVPAADKGKTVIVGAGDDVPWATDAANGTVTGLLPDLMTQIDSILGIKSTFTQTDGTNAIPGVESGRYDIVAPEGDFVQRHSVIDETDFAKDVSSIMVLASGSFHPKTILDTCGSTLAIESGGATPQTIAAMNKQCKAAGKPLVKSLTYPSHPAMNLAVSSGRAQGVFNSGTDNAVAAAASNGQFQNCVISGLAPLPAAGAIFGMVTKKGSGLAQALQGALAEIYAKGVYTKIFDKYQVSGSAITASQIKVDGSTQSES
jgi:polar amino acid transport system substrate-binding protein